MVVKIIMLAFCVFVMFHEGSVLYCWRWMNELERETETRYATVYSIIITVWLIGYVIGRCM